MLADGGEAIADLAVPRHRAALVGMVASDPTAWRLLSDVDGDALAALRVARARARELTWAPIIVRVRLHPPQATGDDREQYVGDPDAMLAGHGPPRRPQPMLRIDGAAGFWTPRSSANAASRNGRGGRRPIGTRQAGQTSHPPWTARRPRPPARTVSGPPRPAYVERCQPGRPMPMAHAGNR